jgi:hypothetical protein
MLKEATINPWNNKWEFHHMRQLSDPQPRMFLQLLNIRMRWQLSVEILSTDIHSIMYISMYLSIREP